MKYLSQSDLTTFIGFLDLKNIYLDTKNKDIHEIEAEIWGFANFTALVFGENSYWGLFDKSGEFYRKAATQEWPPDFFEH